MAGRVKKGWGNLGEVTKRNYSTTWGSEEKARERYESDLPMTKPKDDNQAPETDQPRIETVTYLVIGDKRTVISRESATQLAEALKPLLNGREG
jgi:hypothetical protein